jgi:hypothetical protein
VALAVGDDPMARQMDIEATAGSYAGERPFGRAANLPSTRPRKPTDADMGPRNWGGGEGGEDDGVSVPSPREERSGVRARFSKSPVEIRTSAYSPAAPKASTSTSTYQKGIGSPDS